MIQHIVLIRWKAEIAAPEIARIAEATQILSTIKGVLKVEIHTNLGVARPELGRGIHHVLIVTLRDKAALAAYVPDPIHLGLAKQLQPAAAELTVVDYES